ncbi:hypothetical protein D9757_008404 [Collybiopsis confluens]|uniref:Uncharacterized protein n=1 Tax=Collybiopsis confluens TaxID=2823264 RepID=A0A8H5CZF8_9AGAR|nr:hypothetical protein D9757_012596 [Collybiopsis confluens]KAF5383386.1 hypothetical protein D9757_008404 [Collybiopsis confluens]
MAKPKPNESSMTSDVQSPSELTSSLPDDISRVATVISKVNLGGDDTGELNESNLAALFKEIESADGVLDGVEDKLDGLLGNLDALLAALEHNQEAKKGEGSGTIHPDIEENTLSKTADTSGDDGKPQK